MSVNTNFCIKLQKKTKVINISLQQIYVSKRNEDDILKKEKENKDPMSLYKSGGDYGTVSTKDIYKSGGYYGTISTKDF